MWQWIKSLFDLTVMRRAAAGNFGIPYEIEDFWPIYYFVMREGKMEDYPAIKQILASVVYEPELLRFGNSDAFTRRLYDAKAGEVVPLFIDTWDNVHFYTVKRIYHQPGDDHVYSPKTFHVVYHHTVTNEQMEGLSNAYQSS